LAIKLAYFNSFVLGFTRDFVTLFTAPVSSSWVSFRYFGSLFRTVLDPVDPYPEVIGLLDSDPDTYPGTSESKSDPIPDPNPYYLVPYKILRNFFLLKFKILKY
jgi:hypothetical protein